MAQKLVNECKIQLGIDLLITQGLRTIAEQNAFYAQGRTTPGRIVTQARGGFSFHNFGVAFDVCPLKNGSLDWSYDFNKIGKIGESIGLEHGDRGYIDLPHFQYRAGYTLENFQHGIIDESKFSVESLLNNQHTHMDITKETPQILIIKKMTVTYEKVIDNNIVDSRTVEVTPTNEICSALQTSDLVEEGWNIKITK